MNTPQDNADRLEAFLDGGLTSAERSEFEKKLDLDADLAEQAALQQQVDNSLQRLFAPPPAPAIEDLIAKARFAQSDADQLEAFLDGGLTSEERSEFEKKLGVDADLAEQVELQQEADASLQRLFAPPPAPAIEDLLAKARAASPEPSVAEPVEVASRTNASTPRINRRMLVAVAIAASAAWLVVGVQLFPRNHREVAKFEPRPLTQVYQQVVDQGFKPYWVCEDDVQFAETFEKRQGVPLKLAAMPAGRRMVGLSYLKGISFTSTSLLAVVDDSPVVVFVDKAENDWKPTFDDLEEAGLTVTRTERLGLVFYEVSPRNDFHVADYLVTAK